MASSATTFQRFFEIPGHARTDGFLYMEPSPRRSAVFEACGHSWSLFSLPVQAGYHPNVHEEGVGIWLRLETVDATVQVEVQFGLVDPSANHPVWTLTDGPVAAELVYAREDVDSFGIGVVVPRTMLNYRAPGPGFLTRGGLLFQCTVTVLAPQPDEQQASVDSPSLPPWPLESESDMAAQLARIRATGKGANVTFSVQGVRVPAHRIVLAMRSPVFDAQLFGGMAESCTSSSKDIEVQDVEPQVFHALLDYIYTDALPPVCAGDDDAEHDASRLLCALLVAADRYCIDRLKLLCEHRLCTALTVENVADMLELASDVGCTVLKDACVQFMPERMDQVKASEGYKRLRETCPLVLLEALESGPVKKVCRRDDDDMSDQ